MPCCILPVRVEYWHVFIRQGSEAQMRIAREQSTTIHTLIVVSAHHALNNDICALLDDVGCADQQPATARRELSYYYCVSHHSYAVKGFASLTLALLKLFSLMDSATPNRTKRKILFVFARPYGVTRYAD